MMLIICDKSPDKAVDWLVENTNKQFVWKQLLELCQLICSAGYSDVFKPLKQGKELQNWVGKNITWVKSYGEALLEYCIKNVKLRFETYKKIRLILSGLGHPIWVLPIKTAIWRYSREYSSEYPTNSELPIEVVTELYRKYITEFKFKKSEVSNANI